MLRREDDDSFRREDDDGFSLAKERLISFPNNNANLAQGGEEQSVVVVNLRLQSFTVAEQGDLSFWHCIP